MAALKDLFKKLDYSLLSGDMDKNISEVVYDSRKITKDCLFICISGAKFDGHDFAGTAVQNGAAAIVVEKDVEVPDGTTVIKVNDCRYALAILSAAYFNYPYEDIKVIGITGTKGKTTTTYMIKSILENAGHKVGLIGTIETIIGDKHIKAVNTTPESYIIQETLRKMADEGCDFCVMEVSSQGLMLHRTAGINFEIGIFTNLEPDHIGPNEHTSFEHYLQCKAMLFKQCKLGLVNGDDEHVDGILEGHTCEVVRYGFNKSADYYVDSYELTNEDGMLGTKFAIKGKYDMSVELDMPGRFSIYNALAAIGVCKHFGAADEAIMSAVFAAKVKGRIEKVQVSDKFTLMIDYAHNAMALRSLLETLKEYNPKRIVSVFGCGGNRDRNRRFEMGEVSGELSDLTVITSDNPRFEKPLDIIKDIETGMAKTDGRYVTVPDRKEAIKYVIANGEPGDVIILAGKGHEDYQEIEGVKYPMDERVLIAEVMEELGLK